MKRTDFAAELARRRAHAGFSLADLAARAHVHRGYLHRMERGERWPSVAVVRAVDAALAADGALLGAWEAADRLPSDNGQPTALLELAARAEASDVGTTTLELVELSVDGLARSYTRLPPNELLRDVRTRASQIGRLLDGRATLAQRRRLLTAAGWLALLAATLHVDLGQRVAAAAVRTVAQSLGRETEQDEIGAWVCEVDTWTALVDQDWPRAAELAEAGEAIAPVGSPAAAQLAVQSARAAARLGDGPGCGRRCAGARLCWSGSRKNAQRITICTSMATSWTSTPEPRWRGWATRPRRTTPGMPRYAMRRAVSAAGWRPPTWTWGWCWRGWGDLTKQRTAHARTGHESSCAVECVAG
jgi:transcriptional regulator with XRE-family HTH domain